MGDDVNTTIPDVRAAKFPYSQINKSLNYRVNHVLFYFPQIPFGIAAKKFGALRFLGWGMFINSIFAFLVPISAKYGVGWLILTRFIQGLGEGPIVPCTHALLAKWIPPHERSRMGAVV